MISANESFPKHLTQILRKWKSVNRSIPDIDALLHEVPTSAQEASRKWVPTAIIIIRL